MWLHININPPIIEALCEFTFTPIPHRPKAFSSYCQDSLRPSLELIMRAPLANNGCKASWFPMRKLPSRYKNSLFRIQMPTGDGARILSVGQNTLSVSMLKPYGEDGWEGEFLPRIIRALKAYKKVAKPLNVSRIGVRYINQIQIPEFDANIENYIALKDTTPELLNAKLSSFVRREEYAKEDNTKIIVTCAKTIPATPNHTGILLDIDTIWDFKPIREEKDIVRKVKELHRLEGTVFEALITDAARKLFDA